MKRGTSIADLDGSGGVRDFERFGWRVVRQRGSHIILVKDGQRATPPVSNHPEVARGALRSLIRAAGLTVEAFVANLK